MDLGPGTGERTRAALAAIKVGVAVTQSGRGSWRDCGGADHFMVQVMSGRGGQATLIGEGGKIG